MNELFEVDCCDSELAGVDEVGRGPLAGDVVAAAVILDPDNPIPGLRDSKKLSATKREFLADLIRERALCWSIGRCSVDEIDDINILQASLLAMHRAVQGLTLQPAYVQQRQPADSLQNGVRRQRHRCFGFRRELQQSSLYYSRVRLVRKQCAQLKP